MVDERVRVAFAGKWHFSLANPWNFVAASRLPGYGYPGFMPATTPKSPDFIARGP
jgi:hypothetical protein